MHHVEPQREVTEIVQVVPARPRGELARAASGPVVPRVDVRVRLGTAGDLAFVDRLQKAQAREVGFLPRMALEGKVKLGQVLVAEVYGRPAGYLIAADR